MDDLISRQAAIDTEGLDVQIRCEMCRNPMRSDRGCDGNRKYDEKLYEKIMQILDERIKPLPSAQPEIIRCKDCKYSDEQWRRVAVRWLPCMDVRTESNWFCGSAERREG